MPPSDHTARTLLQAPARQSEARLQHNAAPTTASMTTQHIAAASQHDSKHTAPTTCKHACKHIAAAGQHDQQAHCTRLRACVAPSAAKLSAASACRAVRGGQSRTRIHLPAYMSPRDTCRQADLGCAAGCKHTCGYGPLPAIPGRSLLPAPHTGAQSRQPLRSIGNVGWGGRLAPLTAFYALCLTRHTPLLASRLAATHSTPQQSVSRKKPDSCAGALHTSAPSARDRCHPPHTLLRHPPHTRHTRSPARRFVQQPSKGACASSRSCCWPWPFVVNTVLGNACWL